MPARLRAFRNAGRRSSGVFHIHQSLDVGTGIDELLLVWIASEAPGWETGWHGCRSKNRRVIYAIGDA